MVKKIKLNVRLKHPSLLPQDYIFTYSPEIPLYGLNQIFGDSPGQKKSKIIVTMNVTGCASASTSKTYEYNNPIYVSMVGLEDKVPYVENVNPYNQSGQISVISGPFRDSYFNSGYVIWEKRLTQPLVSMESLEVDGIFKITTGGLHVYKNKQFILIDNLQRD
ncbi:MAG: hypothetical protein LBD35_06965 [Prevotellaceae bacterium]|jgi:hypothetical protein|nr:hypothetical protein [Prevotellaceae bacterium]